MVWECQRQTVRDDGNTNAGLGLYPALVKHVLDMKPNSAYLTMVNQRASSTITGVGTLLFDNIHSAILHSSATTYQHYLV
jgi:hypothetical protein